VPRSAEDPAEHPRHLAATTGRIRATGIHAELVTDDELYAQLTATQLQRLARDLADI
jgi:hypothetical protein